MQVFNRWCSPLAMEVQFQEWRVATGTPILERACADWDEELSWVWQPDDSQTAPISAAIWSPHATFGSDALGAAFVARKSTLTNPGSNTPYWDPRVQFGLDDSVLPPGERPITHLDFALPLRALWIEVNETPGPAGSADTRCGIRFQHRVSGSPAYPAVSLYDLNDDSEISGADLGQLLTAWGSDGPWVDCGEAAVSSLDIEVISLATIELGLVDMDQLMAWMNAMTSEQRAYVAQYLKLRAAAIAAEEK